MQSVEILYIISIYWFFFIEEQKAKLVIKFLFFLFNKSNSYMWLNVIKNIKKLTQYLFLIKNLRYVEFDFKLNSLEWNNFDSINTTIIKSI